MMVAPYKFKKDLKNAIGTELRYRETSLFGPEYDPNGTFCVVGPSEYERKWYAEVKMVNGIISEVS